MMGKFLAVLAIVAMSVACSNCCCSYYLPLPMHWYNNSYDTAPNVTIGIDLQTTGPKPVTILDAESDKINISLYHPRNPNPSRIVNDTGEIIYYRVWSFDNANKAVADLYVYLPRGPNYTIMITQGYADDGAVLNKYSGGNLTLWVNDPAHNPDNLFNVPGISWIED